MPSSQMRTAATRKILSPPRESPGRFPAPGTPGASVLSAASPSPLQPNPKSSSETRTHSSGGRWRGGSREAEGIPRPDSPFEPSPSPQGPSGSPLGLSPRPHTVPTVRHCGRSVWSSLPPHLPSTLNPTQPFPSIVTPHPTLLVALSSPHIPDSGASHILLRSSSLPSLSHLFTPSPVPPISLSQADGNPLTATSGGTISFPNRPPLLTYVVPSSALAHT